MSPMLLQLFHFSLPYSSVLIPLLDEEAVAHG